MTSASESELRTALVQVLERQSSLIDSLERTVQALSRELESLKAQIKDREEEQALVQASQSKADPRTVA
jgi:regulator of replication initiation timing